MKALWIDYCSGMKARKEFIMLPAHCGASEVQKARELGSVKMELINPGK